LGGVVLNTREVGTGRPLVVLPGFGLDAGVMAACFEPAFSSTTGRNNAPEPPSGGHPVPSILPVVPGGVRRIYVDLPGMGSPTGDPTSEAVLAAVVDTLERVGEPVALAAHSYGGYLAAALTRRRPELLERLMLVCPGVVIDRAKRDLTGVLPSSPRGASWLDDVPEALRDHFVQAVGHQTRAVARAIASALADRVPADDAYLERLQDNGYALDDEGHDVTFDRPVVVVTGRHDRVTGYRDQLRLLEKYPAGTFTALAGAGHYLPFEQRARFAAALRDWLAT
jgi:pimeloyl-ACP methyl ester carboxylesterase